MNKKGLVLGIFAVIFICCFAFVAVKYTNFGQRETAQSPNLNYMDTYKELTGLSLESSLTFLENAKSAKLNDFTKEEKLIFENLDSHFSKEDAVELDRDQITSISEIFYLDQSFFPSGDPGLKPVKFCAFTPTYSLTFEMEDYHIQYVICFNCSDVFINILKDGKTYSSPKLAISSPSRDFFEDTLGLSSK